MFGSKVLSPHSIMEWMVYERFFSERRESECQGRETQGERFMQNYYNQGN